MLVIGLSLTGLEATYAVEMNAYVNINIQSDYEYVGPDQINAVTQNNLSDDADTDDQDGNNEDSSDTDSTKVDEDDKYIDLTEDAYKSNTVTAAINVDKVQQKPGEPYATVKK